MNHHFLTKFIFGLGLALGLILPTNLMAKTSNDPKVFQTAYEQIGLYRAWDYSTGSNQVVVAIIDNGFDTFHPDLFGNIWRNTKEIENNEIDDDNNGYVDDIYGWNFLNDNNDPRPNVTGLNDYQKSEGVYSHATVVAGIIGAVGDNAQDSAGVNWKVRLMNLKVLGNEGSGRLSPLGDAIRYAVDNGADVINISMVGDYDSELISALQYAYDEGVVVVAAAGNYGGDLDAKPLYPVCSDTGTGIVRILGVSAVNAERKLANFSNYGTNCIDLTAPGTNIGSTVRYSPNDGLISSYAAGWQGTSFAAPFVAGSAALIKSVRPDWKAPEINNALLSTTHHTPADDEAAYAAIYGKGMLQVHRALAFAMGLPLPPTMFDGAAYVPPVIVTPTLPTSTTTIKPGPHAKTFVAIGAGGQMRDGYNDSAELGGPYERPEAKGIESVSAFGDGAEQIIVTVKPGANNMRMVSVYNHKWQLQYSWNSGFTVPTNIAIGMRDEEVIIALAPTGNHTMLYKLFDTQGAQLQVVNPAQSHQGARIAIVDGLVHTVYTSNNQTAYKLYNTSGLIEKEFPVTGLGPNPYMAIGDVTADSKIDYIFGSGPGLTDMVRIYNEEGQEQRSFSPFGDGRKTGVSVIIVDADNNHTQDLLTYSANTSGLVRAWTPKAKNAGEWQVPFSGSFFLLSR